MRLIVALFCGLLFALRPVTGSADSTTVYRVGVVPQFDARRISNTWTPILEAIAQRTGDRFELVGSARIPVFQKEYEAGKFDFAFMDPYHLLRAWKVQGYRPLVRSALPLRGVLVVPRNGTIRTLSDLNGRRIAFPAPNAFAASLMTRAELARRGVRYEPVYVSTHSSVYLNVAKHQTAAGGGAQQTYDVQPPALREQLHILYVTPGVPSHPVAAHRRVPMAVQDRVQQALLALGNTESGRMLLAQATLTQIVPAVLDDYLPLEQLGLEKFFVRDAP